MVNDPKHHAIWYEAGTGKTICALTAILEMAYSGEADNALIVCPASLVPMWQLSIKQASQFSHISDDDVRILEAMVHVQSLSSVWTTYKKTVKHRTGRTTTSKKYIIRPEIDKPWDVCIVDEAHCIGSHNSVQTNTMLKLAKHIKHRYIMTGTPDSGGGDTADYRKLYGQIKFLDPDIWNSYGEWDSIYVYSHDPWGNPYGYCVPKCEELKREYGIVARLADCYDMPGSIESILPCPLKEKTIYEDIVHGKVKEYNITINSAGGGWIKLMQLCSGHIKTDKGIVNFTTSKTDMIRTELEGNSNKIVIFCQFTESIRMLSELCSKMKVSHYVFDGHEKRPLWQQFQKDDTKVFISQYARGGAGIDLYAADTMIFYEPTPSALLLDQAKARIMRKGQTKQCRYLYLVTPGTVEAKMSESTRKGVTVTRDMLNKWARESYRTEDYIYL